MVHVILDEELQEIKKLDLVEEPISVDDDECNDDDSNAEMFKSLTEYQKKYSRLEIMKAFHKIESHFALNNMLTEHRLSIQRSRLSVQMRDQLNPKKTPPINKFMGPPLQNNMVKSKLYTSCKYIHVTHMYSMYIIQVSDCIVHNIQSC